MKNLLTLLLTVTISVSLVFAQAPQGLSYQAIAFNTGGTPIVNGNVGVKISILDNSITGTVVYSETHTKTTTAQGLFNLNIGQGTPVTGTFSTINWAINSKFLKVELDPNGGTNYISVSTNQIMSVPYSLYAKDVENINASNIVCSIEPDSIGIGVMTNKYGYAFDNNQWYQQSLNGIPQEIISTGRKIGIMTNGYGYAFNNNQWYQQLLNGIPQEIIGNSGVIGIMTNRSGYAFSNNQWYQQSLNGVPQKIVARDGKILIYTNSYAYTFDKATSQWHSQPLSGTVLDYAH